MIEAIAASILERSPGVVVHYRLLRDVLKAPPGSPELREAKDALRCSRRVQELANEQHEDGSWGRFHSRDTQQKQVIPTTEVGIERALSLGLEAAHPILRRACTYILETMMGNRAFPDRAEVNDRWETGVRLFLASTLSLIQPDHPALEPDREVWGRIARRTFQSGVYCETDEMKAHTELTGATVKDSYLVLSSKYQLNLLGSIPGMLSGELEMALLQWLWGRADGIGYLGVPLNQPPSLKPGPLDRWLASLELLSRGYPRWVHFAQPSIEWLWEQSEKSGTWDFGPRPGSVAALPLSDSWRRRQDRRLDWMTRVLTLMRRYYDRSL